MKQVKSMLLAQSSSEELDVLGKEAEVFSELASSLDPAYNELVEIVGHTSARLKLAERGFSSQQA